MIEDAGEVVDDVADGDGLGRGGDPHGRDHDGQPFDQVAEDFEGGRTGADDHGGSEDGDGDAGGAEGGFHVATGGEVFAEVGAGFAEAAEVDDSLQPGLFGGESELGGEVVVLLGVVGTGGHHGVNEVEGGVAAL